VTRKMAKKVKRALYPKGPTAETFLAIAD